MIIWKYREYIIYNMRARLLSETINNHLGLLWLILEPLFRMFIFYFVFVHLLKIRTENFVSFLLVGIMAIMWFTKTVIQGGNGIRAAGGLIRQCYLPKLIFPTIICLVRTMDFFIIMALLMAYFALTGSVHVTWVAVPFIIISQFLLTYGVTLFAAGIIPFIPDVSILINSAMTALFFLSGVFYEILPSDPNYHYFMLNPVAKLMEQYRWALLHGRWPDWTSLLIISGGSIVFIVIMAFFIKKMDRDYPRFAV